MEKLKNKKKTLKLQSIRTKTILKLKIGNMKRLTII